MNHTTQIHNVDKVEVSKTTQDSFNGVEKVNIKAGEHEITIFGSEDEKSDKKETIGLEVEDQ